MEIVEKHILDFDGENDYKPNNHPPKEDGFYMTIRCGYGGIYTDFNEWREEHWMKQVLDGSSVIAYSRQPLPREKANEWLDSLLKKSKRDVKNGKFECKIPVDENTEDKLYQKYLAEVQSFEKYGGKNLVTFEEWLSAKTECNIIVENVEREHIERCRELLGHTSQDVDDKI